MRDVAAGVAEIKHWARDPNLAGVYLSPQAPDGKLLDNPDLHPLYGGGAGPGSSRCWPTGARRGRRTRRGPSISTARGSLLHSFGNPWAGMAALGALIGGGIFEMFRELPGRDHRDRRRLAAAGDGSAGHPLSDVAEPRAESEATAARRARRGPLLPRHRQLGALGRVLRRGAREDLWLFATDWPHGDTRRGRRACSRSPDRHGARRPPPGARCSDRTRCGSVPGWK